MTQEIVIPYVRGKIADGCKRFDLDIVMRMVVEYDRVQNHLGEMKAENNRMLSEIVSANVVANSATTELDQCGQAFAALKMKLSVVAEERDELKRYSAAVLDQNEKLDTENKKLRVALTEIVNGDGDPWTGIAWKDIARKALDVAK